MKAVPSTTHGMIKFPIRGGTLTLRSSKIIPIECAMISGPEDQPPPVNKVKEERIKRSLDIFAWTPTDMTGVPRQIAEHKLNVRKGCQPVRQKKRGQAAERNIAINDELVVALSWGVVWLGVVVGFAEVMLGWRCVVQRSGGPTSPGRYRFHSGGILLPRSGGNTGGVVAGAGQGWGKGHAKGFSLEGRDSFWKTRKVEPE
ncbi:hypothetical protein Tco_0991731, partial [Tanacetum coccineum]